MRTSAGEVWASTYWCLLHTGLLRRPRSCLPLLPLLPRSSPQLLSLSRQVAELARAWVARVLAAARAREWQGTGIVGHVPWRLLGPSGSLLLLLKAHLVGW